MFYIQRICRGSQDPDEVKDIVETPEEAADRFEEIFYLDDWEYNREELIEGLEEQGRVSFDSAIEHNYSYVLIAQP